MTTEKLKINHKAQK